MKNKFLIPWMTFVIIGLLIVCFLGSYLITDRDKIIIVPDEFSVYENKCIRFVDTSITIEERENCDHQVFTYQFYLDRDTGEGQILKDYYNMLVVGEIRNNKIENAILYQRNEEGTYISLGGIKLDATLIGRNISFSIHDVNYEYLPQDTYRGDKLFFGGEYNITIKNQFNYEFK